MNDQKTHDWLRTKNINKEINGEGEMFNLKAPKKVNKKNLSELLT